MKIEGPQGPKQAGKAARAGDVSASDAALFRGLMAPDEGTFAAPASTTQQIAALDVLLALQGAEDPTERATRGRMAARAQLVLDGLERLRVRMLAGTLTVGHMIDVADVVASHREKIRDPQLSTVMDEIDLRAQVELAKMRQALDHGSPAHPKEGDR